MDKSLVAARMNSADELSAVLNAGTKAPRKPKSNRTYKLVESVPDDVYLVFNPDNQVIASIIKGSDKNWQVVTADMSTILNYKFRPSLARVMADI